MMTTLSLRRTLLLSLSLILLAGMAAAPQPARADVIEDFASVLDQLPPGVFQVSGKDIRDSREFFEDLQNLKPVNDKTVGELLLKYKNKPVGQKALTAGGGDNIPSWFWDLLETYIAFRNGDFWGVVENLGSAAICIVAQYMAGGNDVCFLLESLVELAESFEDALKTVGKFLESLGGIAGDVGCALTLTDCGDSKPPEYYAYEYLFKPNIPEGAKRIEASDSLFYPFLDKLKTAAQSKQPAGTLLWQIGYANGFSPGVVNNAAKMFSDAADANWTKHYVNDVIPALDDARKKYATPQKIAEVAQKVASVQSNHVFSLVTLCENDFKGPLGFLGLDRWMSKHQKDASDLHVKSHHEWCEGTFFAKNKDAFAQHFREYAKSHYCPESGKKLLCPTVAKYKVCASLFGSVGLYDQCDINVSSAGLDLANSIKAGFQAKGSKYECTITKAMSSPGSKSTSVGLVCTRPTQWHECEEKDTPVLAALPPIKLVNCVLQETVDYKKLKDKVAGAIASLNQEYPNPPKGIPFLVDPVDPLMVHAPSTDIAAKVKAKNRNFGFGSPSAKPGFEYLPPNQIAFPHTVDGVNTPLLGSETKLPKIGQAVQLETMKEKVTLGAEQLQGLGATKALSGSAPAGAGPGAGKTGASSIGAGASAPMKAAPGAISAPKGPDLGGAPVPAPTSGPAPAPGGRLASQGSARTPAAADIKSGPRVTVAGKFHVAWGQGITVSDADARRAANGVCDVAVTHDTLNVGKSATGPFGRRWANRQNPASFTDAYPSIPAGGSLPRTDTLPLKPGVNNLTLGLDHLNQVKEGNESDNIYQITITVSGSCGTGRGATPGGSPGGGPVRMSPQPAGPGRSQGR